MSSSSRGISCAVLSWPRVVVIILASICRAQMIRQKGFEQVVHSSVGRANEGGIVAEGALVLCSHPPMAAVLHFNEVL